MKILVDIIHPAHVHFFRYAIAEWQSRGHTVAVTARQKDVTIELLDRFMMPYTTLSRVGHGLGGLGCELIRRDWRLWRFCRRFKPDVLTGISGVFIAHVGFLLHKPSVVWDDTEHQQLAHRITWPFATAVYSPQSYNRPPVKKQHLYPGCHELAYLHPNCFTPDRRLVAQLGIDPGSRYCIIRFVSWGAHHDVGQHGLTDSKKLDFITSIEPFARPYITSEGQLPEELRPYQLHIPVHQLHHVLAFASLCVAEGATVASEAALLGVPAVYVNTLRAGTIDRLERAGLLRQTTDTRKALQMSLEWLADKDALENSGRNRDTLLQKEIDVTALITETVERAGKGGR
ncbi:MAG: DUF354 domain-containing protein [Sedimentisphaerales bacterium]|nr:DUF354 domain-containing protein [Sedimentisphaerales bacterium]